MIRDRTNTHLTKREGETAFFKSRSDQIPNKMSNRDAFSVDKHLDTARTDGSQSWRLKDVGNTVSDIRRSNRDTDVGSERDAYQFDKCNVTKGNRTNRASANSIERWAKCDRWERSDRHDRHKFERNDGFASRRRTGAVLCRSSADRSTRDESRLNPISRRAFRFHVVYYRAWCEKRRTWSSTILARHRLHVGKFRNRDREREKRRRSDQLERREKSLWLEMSRSEGFLAAFFDWMNGRERTRAICFFTPFFQPSARVKSGSWKSEGRKAHAINLDWLTRW